VKNWFANVAAKVVLFAVASILLAAPPTGTSSTKCTPCARDSRLQIRRSAIAKRAFRQSHACPSTGKTSGACSGYEIGHVKLLKLGGADEPGNMQWQTVADAKTKDRVE
jgi:hypothetical protein